MEAGSLFERQLIANKSTLTNCFNFSVPPQKSVASKEPFCLKPFSVADVKTALIALDPSKSPGPDTLEHYFLQIAADFIAEPIAIIFNQTLVNNEIPRIWKSAYVLPLLKGGDYACLDNYRPISKLPILASVRNIGC